MAGLVDAVTRNDLGSALTFMIPISMITLGFPLGTAVSGGFKINPKFSAETSQSILYYMAISTSMFFIINVTKQFAVSINMVSDALLPQTVVLAIIPLSMFAVIMAVSEEIFFRYYLTKLFSNMKNNWTAIIFVGMGLFPTYHLWRYGPYPPLLIVTALCGAVLSWAYIRSGTPSAVLLPHALVNYMGFVSQENLMLLTIMVIVASYVFYKKRGSKQQKIGGILR
ncbi:CPBP family intramembrane glutamic endopeptidase [Thermoproteota archaeon]